MDRASLLGMLLGVALLALAIGLGPHPRVFLHPASATVVLGGILAATLVRFPLAHVREALIAAARAFGPPPPPPQVLVNQILGLAQVARREGLLRMERGMDVDGFLAQGLRLVVDGVDRDTIQTALTQELGATQERQQESQEIFRFVALSAPSFGMVGTLIGMVQLFASLKDPSALGGALALSLLSTLYGAVIAYLVAIPMAGKLEVRGRQELLLKRIMLAGALGIEARLHPSALTVQLRAFLGPHATEPERRGHG